MINILERSYPTQVIGDILANHLRVVEDDAELYKDAQTCVLNAISAAEVYTNRILVDSLVTISFDKIETRVIELPTAPVRDIIEVRYYGMDGEWHTLDAKDYNLVSNSMRAMIELRELPAVDATRMLDVFEIDARVGFEDVDISSTASVAHPLPGSITAALMLMSATFLENPADVAPGANELPLNARMLLSPYRITPYGL